MHSPPTCQTPGPQCHALDVTLRVATLEGNLSSGDHEATWLLGHTQRISFRNLRHECDHLLVDATLHVRCRYLEGAGSRSTRRELWCRAHGFRDVPPPTPPAHQPRRLGGDRFLLVTGGQSVETVAALPTRALPVLPDSLDDVNPCSIAPCTTADHTRGSACCRDLQVEIVCPERDTRLEALLRSRLSPYLCKLTRENGDTLEAEMISACGYLDDDGLNCTLHDRSRPDGRPAKPDLCTHWPDDGKGLHPGCIFA